MRYSFIFSLALATFTGVNSATPDNLRINNKEHEQRELSGGEYDCGTPSTTAGEIDEFSRVVTSWVGRNSGRTLFANRVTTYFHVITDGTIGSVTTAQIQQNLERLNDDFFPHNFRFVQGRGSPAFYDNSNWFYSNWNSAADREMKSTLRRGGPDALNVYINLARSNNQELGGYANFAQWYCTYLDQDGININYKSVPGEAWGQTGKILTHEVGHWLNLPHTFQNGCNSPGDGIDDTPYHQQVSDRSCPTNRDTCRFDSFFDPVHNYMNYVDDSCRSEFTNGQSEAMQAAWDEYRLNCDCGCTGGPVLTDSTGRASACFSPFATLIVQGKGKTLMKDVVVGDMVLVSSSVDDIDAENYQEIYAFGHKDVYAKANFLQITTSGSTQGETPLEITGEHLLMKQNSLGEGVPVRADSIEVGDFLLGNKGVAELVTQISSITRYGMYSPLTKDGTVIVNGLQASSYTAMEDQNSEEFIIGNYHGFLSHHFMSHTALAPFRSMCLASGGFLQLCSQQNREGQMLFAAEGEGLVRWIMKQAIEVQAAALTILLFSMLSFRGLETVFGSFVTGVCLLPLVWLLAREFVRIPRKVRHLMKLH